MKQTAAKLIVMLALALECGAIAAFVKGAGALSGGLHLLAIAGCIYGIVQLGFQRHERTAKFNLTLWLLLLVCAVPGLGPWMIGVPALIWTRPSRTARRVQFLGPEDVYHGDEQRSADPDYEASDMLAIIRSDSDDERRRAILGLRTYDPSAAIPVLKRCLQDSDELVRIYAQGILQNLQENLEKRSRALQAELTDETDTDARINLELRLAETQHEYVFLGLADEEVARRSIMENALASVKRAVELAPERNDLQLVQLRYEIELRATVAAEATMEKLRTNGFDRFLLQPWACELAYLKRDWAALRRLAAEAEESRMAYGRMLSACAFWREGMA
ncbi:HEAT repeat domain-containing protein [Cerasicoccus fimbriatus]|uniref:HEAT repeat domain-containing protein n=1 Tax=Cerasicoccus fimbriatus TaxID=3014554 RepID=UPI0022B576A5|nr:HEAT repeat domain-containing protein [Cerasicoccus sp. TK19100]